MLETDSGNHSNFLRKSPGDLRTRPRASCLRMRNDRGSKRKEAGIRTELDIEMELCESLREKLTGLTASS